MGWEVEMSPALLPGVPRCHQLLKLTLIPNSHLSLCWNVPKCTAGWGQRLWGQRERFGKGFGMMGTAGMVWEGIWDDGDTVTSWLSPGDLSPALAGLALGSHQFVPSTGDKSGHHEGPGDRERLEKSQGWAGSVEFPPQGKGLIPPLPEKQLPSQEVPPGCPPRLCAR